MAQRPCVLTGASPPITYNNRSQSPSITFLSNTGLTTQPCGQGGQVERGVVDPPYALPRWGAAQGGSTARVRPRFMYHKVLTHLMCCLFVLDLYCVSRGGRRPSLAAGARPCLGAVGASRDGPHPSQPFPVSN